MVCGHSSELAHGERKKGTHYENSRLGPYNGTNVRKSGGPAGG
jgi:hypothetical protein